MLLTGARFPPLVCRPSFRCWYRPDLIAV